MILLLLFVTPAVTTSDLNPSLFSLFNMKPSSFKKKKKVEKKIIRHNAEIRRFCPI